MREPLVARPCLVNRHVINGGQRLRTTEDCPIVHVKRCATSNAIHFPALSTRNERTVNRHLSQGCELSVSKTYRGPRPTENCPIMDVDRRASGNPIDFASAGTHNEVTVS